MAVTEAQVRAMVERAVREAEPHIVRRAQNGELYAKHGPFHAQTGRDAIPGLGHSHTKIINAAGTTKWDTEESAAENLLRADADGVERMAIGVRTSLRNLLSINSTAKTISGDTITLASPDTSYIVLTGEGGAADDLTLITGAEVGDIVILAPASDSVSITVKHNAGGPLSGYGIFLNGDADLVLDDVDDRLMLQFAVNPLHAQGTSWVEISRAGGGSGISAHAMLDGGTAHSDTAADTVTRGSIIVGNSTPAWDELPVGTARQALVSDGTDPAWRTTFLWLPMAHWFIGGFLRADTSNHQGAVIPLPDWAQAAALVEGSSIKANVATAPTDADVEIDIKHSATWGGAQTSIFAGGTPNYITLQAGDNTVEDAGSDDGTLTTTTFDGGFFRLFVRQAGSTEPGRDLTVDVFAKVFLEF